MQSNPYAEIAKAVKSGKATTPSWCTGKVLSISPITVEIAQEPVSGNNLLCNTLLLTAYHEEDRIEPNDTVLVLISPDNQTYTVICKVV